MNQQNYFAVLTGDIVKSSRLSTSNLEAVRSAVFEAVDVAKGWKRGLIKGKPEFFRGDAWQLLLKDPAMALRVAVFVRAALRAQGVADSRISIGLGEVESISRSRVSLSTGEGFSLSGHGLDSMTQYSRMTVVIPQSAGPLAGWLPVVAHLCDSLIGGWTQRQAEIVCVAVDPQEPTHEEIAEGLNPAVSKQSVTKSLNGANWHAVREAIHQFEKMAWETVLAPKQP